jgi:2-polyprenyl-3-methyl-5-hydroxy-6-metoxy-1,4-benzoquinol methylase
MKTPVDWDQSYKAGQYDGAGDRNQGIRYALIAGVVREAGLKSLLDVGCGHGGLRDFLPDSVTKYTGLDISSVALQGANFQRDERTICANVEVWEPDDTYDCIVLSEVIYYCRDVEEVLHKLRGCLRPGGVMIVSVFHHRSRFSQNYRALKRTRRFLSSGELVADFQIVSEMPSRHTWSTLASQLG